MNTERKVILYIAMSLDGYIAQPGDDLGFLSMVEKTGEDYGYTDFINSVDVVIMGRRTYDKVLTLVSEFPHSDKDAYIVTRTAREPAGSVKFYTGSLSELVAWLKSQPGKNIFVDGGAEVVHALLNDHLIDELIISIIPILLGDGIDLFKNGRPEAPLKLLEARTFDTGLVQLHYARRG